MLYETIFKRRSVRKYDKDALAPDVLDDIKSYLANIKQLKNENAVFKFVGKNEVSNNWAPHYVLAFCADTTTAYINVGFVLQELDLYLQSKGLGVCWLGIPKPKDKSDKETYAIMLAFGATSEPERAGEKDFSRFPISKISNEDNPVARAGMLAPSAVNSQPWHFTFEQNRVLINFAANAMLSKIVLKRKMNKVDIGIVTKIIEVALLKEGKTVLDITAKESESGYGAEIRWSE
jgi:nitroreductase